MSKRCSAKNKSGNRCGAWSAAGRDKCALHLDPERAAEIGSKHGRRATFPHLSNASDLPHRPLQNMAEVGELLEETINRVRQGPFDLRAANAIGYLAGILLKALDQRIEERLAHLEAVMTGNGGTEAEVFDIRPAKEPPNEKPTTSSKGD
jgi:hypothetical protein